MPAVVANNGFEINYYFIRLEKLQYLKQEQ